MEEINIEDIESNNNKTNKNTNKQNNIDNTDIEFNDHPNADQYYEKNDKKFYDPNAIKSKYTINCVPTNYICFVSLAITIYAMTTIISLLPLATLIIFSNYLMNKNNNNIVCNSNEIGTKFELYLLLFIVYAYITEKENKKFITINMHRVLKKYMKILNKTIYIIDLSIFISTFLLIFGLLVINNKCFHTNVYNTNKSIYIICNICVVYNVFYIFHKTLSGLPYVIYKEQQETIYVQKKPNNNDDNDNYIQSCECFITLK